MPNSGSIPASFDTVESEGRAKYIKKQFFVKFRSNFNLSFSCVPRILPRVVDPDTGGQKLPTNIERNKEYSCFEVLDVLF